MKIKVDIESGPCGHKSTVVATTDDGMFADLTVDSNCDKIGILSAMLMAQAPVPVASQLDPMTEGSVMALIRKTLTGACSGCATPVAIIKAMQIMAGKAVMQDIHLSFSETDDL